MITPNKQEATLDQVLKIRLKEPEDAGNYFVGIKHGTFLNALFEGMEKAGMKIQTDRYALTKDKRDLVASFDVHIPGKTPPKGFIHSIGVIASNSRLKRNRFAIGVTHKPTSTGFVTGLITLGKRTSGFDLNTEIEQALNEYKERIDNIEPMIQVLKSTTLSQKQVDHIIMRASRITPLSARPPWEKLGKALRVYQNTSMDSNAWDLVEAFAIVAKKSQVFKQIPQLIRFRQVVTKTAGVKV